MRGKAALLSSRADLRRVTILAIGLAMTSLARVPAAQAPASPPHNPVTASAAPADDPLVSLDSSTRPLEEYFNQSGDQIRFLALLSPT